MNIKKFKGLPREYYNISKLRIEHAFKGKGLWRILTKDSPNEDAKEKPCLISVEAIGDSPNRECQSALGEPLKMMQVLNDRSASKRTSNRVTLLSAVFTKRYNNNTHMGNYIDEFNTLFSQLKSMGKEHAIPEGLKPILLMSSTGKDSPLEGILGARRMKDSEYLTWGSVCAGLIQQSEFAISLLELMIDFNVRAQNLEALRYFWSSGKGYRDPTLDSHFYLTVHVQKAPCRTPSTTLYSDAWHLRRNFPILAKACVRALKMQCNIAAVAASAAAIGVVVLAMDKQRKQRLPQLRFHRPDLLRPFGVSTTPRQLLLTFEGPRDFIIATYFTKAEITDFILPAF